DRTTLAVVCFPLGTWVGGLYTLACVRHLAAKGYPITAVAPGNNKAEILRVIPELAAQCDQPVLLGYPPFVKDVIDTGTAAGLDWTRYAVKLVLAGEVFSEEWRDLVGQRAGMRSPCYDSASLYGTADAGVLGTETPLSVCIRRFLASRPEAAGELFGEARLPTLVQYDPGSRFFEAHEGTLLFSADNGNPHLSVTVGLAPGEAGDAARERVLAESIRAQLQRLNSEFAHYVPAGYQLPKVTLRPAGDPEYFPVGVKHRYTRGKGDQS